ncbi:3-phytase [Purpureocillium takamizusanense]|uniref:3-phytase n=1 Tax=Purpureocillium takamizusanense TaxID=2060973 RepID=A0A9Q8QCI8_9HYPO|nr:3-phytase [Purpureocillium takamizusanense]UNI17130.1 3-phytase [Purpureocillium takamizusanense]
MALAVLVAAFAVVLHVWATHGAPTTVVVVNVTAMTDTVVASDWTATFYSDREPLLLGNDAGPDTGGIRAYSLESPPPLPGSTLREHASAAVVRTKLATSVYGVGVGLGVGGSGKDRAITIAQPDSIMLAFALPSLTPVRDAQSEQLGDWSALSSWKCRTTGNHQYLFLFGKRQAVQLLVRTDQQGEKLDIDAIRP